MGKPKPIRPTAPESKGTAAAAQGRGARLLALVLSALLAVTTLPAAGLQAGSAFADEPAGRPAAVGGDVALQSASGGTEASAPVAQTREDGMLVAGGLLYTVADGGLALVGFDADAAEASALEGALSVPAAVSVDGRDVAVVAVDLAGGQAAPGAVSLLLPQSVKDIEVGTLASAFPGLLSVEVASGQGSTLPAAAGAAAMRATYSSFGGALLGQATVEVEGEGGSMETVQCRELLWAPPAAVAVRLPVDCLSVAPGALADAKGLETIVCFGDVRRIAAAERGDAGSVTVPGALTDEQLETVTVVFPDATPAVPSEGDGRVSASMALNDGATQTDKRHAWIALGLPLERLSMGKPVGALTETVAVTEEGAPASDEAQLVSYPGMHPKATDVKHPGEDGKVDMADNGLAYEMKSDMTLSVHWEGDPTATPAHLEIPATVAIDGVTYPVTEIAPEAFKGAVFLESVSIPDSVTVIDGSAFVGCINLTNMVSPAAFRVTELAASEGATVSEASLSGEQSVVAGSDDSVAPFLTSYKEIELTVKPEMAHQLQFFEVARMEYNVIDDRRVRFRYTGDSENIYWQMGGGNSAQVYLFAHFPNGDTAGHILISCPEGWVVTGCSVRGNSWGNTDVLIEDSAILWLGRSKIRDTSYDLLNTNSFEGTGSATTAARSDHDHDSRYYTKSEVDIYHSGYVTIEGLANYNYITKAATELDNFYDKAKFNAISYGGLEEADRTGAMPTFYVSDASKLPTVPEPSRKGHEFLGWTWDGQDAPTKDASGAFSGGGAVTLTANWEDSPLKASYFFSEEDPYDSGSAGDQADVIAVKLSSEAGRTLESIRFEDNSAGLAPSGSAIEFQVDNDKGMNSANKRTLTGWGSTATASIPLVALEGGGYGVYVKATVRSGAVDASKVVESYADGSYVASFAKLNYVLA